jgi:hypothetical protein
MVHAMDNEDTMQPTTTTRARQGSTSRRGLFGLGAATLTAAVLAACSETEDNQITRLGEGGTTPELPDAEVNDGVRLRTMAGIENSIANAYLRMIEDGLLAESSATYPRLGDTTDLVDLFREHHVEAGRTFNELAVDAGAEPWECGNTRLDDAYLFPIFDRVLDGAGKTDTAAEIAPSEDAVRDFANLVHALETLSAESCQALVAEVATAEVRQAAMAIGVRSARQAAYYALRLNPGGYVPASTATSEAPAAPTGDGPPLTEIPVPVAVPTQFGALSAITYVGGNGDENGVRLKLNLETPSLNSLAYAYMECAKG